MASILTEKLKKLLVEKKLISEEDLKKAMETFTTKGGELSELLVKMGLINRKDLLAALSVISQHAPVDLSRVDVDADILKLIPKKVCNMYNVLPISRIGNMLTVAMVDPANIFALDDLNAITGLDIVPVVADVEDIRESIRRFFEKSAYEEISDIVEDMSGAEMEMVAEEKEEVTSGDLLRIIEETPVVKLTNMIITQAVKERASDILIEPMERNFRVRYRIDGILHIRHTPPKKYLRALISRLKVMSNLNIAESRLPQDGRFKLRIEDRRIDFRVSVVPSILGEKANLRILDKEEVTINIDQLGLKKRDRDVICQASEVPNGMILACGPTGSGKTTTLYSILKYVDSSEKNLVTAEDPIEYQLAGINQVSINPAIGLTFAGCLRSILRQDPDVIMVGEIRDFETVDIAIKSALTGHLVLSTLHTNTACGAIVRLMNMGVEPYLVASSVVLIVAQRLVRKLCPECKEPYVPSREVAEKYGIFDSKGGIPQIYRARSCKRCRNTGYLGRTVIAECLRITATVRDMLGRNIREFDIEKTARKEGMMTLRQNGIENVIDGVTSLEEVLHVTAETKEMVE